MDILQVNQLPPGGEPTSGDIMAIERGTVAMQIAYNDLVTALSTDVFVSPDLSGLTAETGATGDLIFADRLGAGITLEHDGLAISLANVAFDQTALTAPVATDKMILDRSGTIGANPLSDILKLVYPVGSYYTQYPDASSNTDATEFPTTQYPANLFGGTWVSQWDTESIFFRTGGTLATSGRTTGKQEDQMQQITGSAGVMHTRASPTKSGALNGSTILSTGYVASGSLGETITLNFDSANSTGARTGTETRSVNRRIKVWKRTAL